MARQNLNQNLITRGIKREFDRSKCKRGLDICVNYSKCSSQRLKLNGGKWEPPPENNTVHCFKAAAPEYKLYTSWLGGGCWFINVK